MIVKMAARTTCVLFFSLCFTMFVFHESIGYQWPISYKRFSYRPDANPYCKAGVIPFCPSGNPSNTMPMFADDDKIEIYAMKKPVWQFEFGNLTKRFNIMHDAIGIKNLKTGLNYTMEWYELFQLLNCTFPHVLKNNSLEWCNQGASCIYNGIVDKLWKENGTLVKVADMTGSQFNNFADWVLWDNRTGIYYETWTVENKVNGKLYFDSFDCARWVLRAFDEMAKVGAKFNTSIHLNYTRIHLYSEEPIYLGNASSIFGSSGNKTTAQNLVNFYANFQPHRPTLDMVKELLGDLYEVYVRHEFYFFYNFEYWYLKLVDPYVKLTYYVVPLPGPK